MFAKNKMVFTGEFFFLVAVALLIVRNNSYPWFIKRSSDILFLISASIVAIHFILNDIKKIFSFFSGEKFKKSLAGLALIFLGLGVATFFAFLIDGWQLTGEGALEIGRFAEVAAILLLSGFLQSNDSDFYKRVAFAQLSTLTYLAAFFIPNLIREMYRFQLFENWPSNVGYYLVVSLSLTAVLFLKALNDRRKIFFLWYAAAIGFTAVLLWTQTRAAWLSAALSLILVIFLVFRNDRKKFAGGFLLIILLPILGLFILPSPIQNLIISRFYPQTLNFINVNTAHLNDTLKTIISDKFSPQFNDPRRIFLWTKYSEKLLERPLGLGVNFNPLELVNAVQGPHNTILEILVLAGPIGLAGFSYLFYLGFKNILKEMKSPNNWRIYLAAALLGLLVTSMFDNMSTFRLMWLILGFAIFAGDNRKA